MNENKNRIGNSTIIIMLTIAIIFDLLGLGLGLLGIGLILNRGIAVAGGFIYGLWFYLKGVNLFSFDGKNAIRKLAAAGTGAVVEIIPFLGMLPGFTISVAAILGLVRLEDKTGISAGKVASVAKGRTLSKEKQKVIERKGGELKVSRRTA